MSNQPTDRDYKVKTAVRELLNDLHHKCGYRTAMIQEITDFINEKLKADANRQSY